MRDLNKTTLDTTLSMSQGLKNILLANITIWTMPETWSTYTFSILEQMFHAQTLEGELSLWLTTSHMGYYRTFSDGNGMDGQLKACNRI